MFIAYNLRRIGNILTREVLKEYLRMLVPLFLAIIKPSAKHFNDLCKKIFFGYSIADQKPAIA
jgi:hypothetical protein